MISSKSIDSSDSIDSSKSSKSSESSESSESSKASASVGRVSSYFLENEFLATVQVIGGHKLGPELQTDFLALSP